jgi:acyl-CoA dehydrogenase
MSSHHDLLVTTVQDILVHHQPFVLTPDRRWDPSLWQVLVEAGLTGVGLSEAAGGSGGELADAVAVVSALARGAAAVPVAEQLLVAGPALERAGLELPPPQGPLTVGLSGVAATGHEGRWVLCGTAPDAPWAAVSDAIAVVATGPDGPLLTVVRSSDVSVGTSVNMAGEPRGQARFDRVSVTTAIPVSSAFVAELRARYAIARAVQLSAAMEQILALTVQYAGEREQFGRPLASFQAIQMDLGEIAGEVTAVGALVHAAAQAIGRRSSEDLVLAAAAAKVRAGAAVQVVAKSAHQVHGAIGFSQEHRLHHLTRRCWSWRDEAGSELEWSRILAAGVLTGGGDRLWAALTRVV